MLMGCALGDMITSPLIILFPPRPFRGFSYPALFSCRSPVLCAKSLVDWYSSLEEYALVTLLNGGSIPGYKAVEGTSKTTFAPYYDAAAAVLIEAGYDRAALYRETPETLSALDKLVGGRIKLKELLGDHLYKPAGKPTLAPENDKRPPYSSAAADFRGEAS